MQASLPSTPGLLPSTTSLCQVRPHRALVVSFSRCCVRCVLCNRWSAPQPTECAFPAPADVSDIYVWGMGQLGQLGLDPESEFKLEDQYVV
jgi:hypothetical protein